MAALEWHKAPERMEFGDLDVAEKAQFYCYYLKEKDGRHWRLPEPDELAAKAHSGASEGLYWSSALSKKHGEAIVVDMADGRSHPKPISERHWVYCVYAK